MQLVCILMTFDPDTPVGIENGLFYTGFVVGTNVAGVGDGIIAQSQPNVAAV